LSIEPSSGRTPVRRRPQPPHIGAVINSHAATVAQPAADRKRWIALVIVCLGQLMSVLDTTVVNVALTPIQRDLHFSQANLTWVINAYLIAFGSFLLMAGRLGDLIGRKRVFLVGVAIFTAFSAVCGLAENQTLLIVARFVQGLGGALSVSVILAIIVTEFPRPAERARAMSAYMFVVVSGGSIGLLAGGALTQAINWHWIFFINVPIGVVTLVLGNALIEENKGLGLSKGVDVLGSILVTVAMMLGVYAIVEVTKYGWGSAHTLGLGGGAAALLAAFLVLESRLENPIMPPRILRLRSLIGSSVVRGFLVTGMYATFFLGALYLEHILHYSAVKTGFAFLPMTLAVAALSLGVTARLVGRFGAKRTLIPGLFTVIAALVLLSRAGAHASYFPSIFLPFLLLGIGTGTSFMPLLTIAMVDVPTQDAGLGSGIVNVSQQVSAALGLAVLSTIATNHTRSLTAHGHAIAGALISGYHLAFVIAAACVAVGILVALVVLRAPGSAHGEREAQRLAVEEQPVAEAV
jgi:EmrB/QacA subfamily drug resistance transporter